jgi:hypothetical protein
VTVAVSTVDMADAKAAGKLTVAVEVSEAGEIATCSGVTGSSAYATACVTYK